MAPIIKSFSIRKLNGYKDITLSFRNDVQIVVAENGSGKTTALNAIRSIITNDIIGLLKLDFESCEINLKNADINIKRNEISPLNNSDILSIKKEIKERLGLEPSSSEIDELLMKLVATDSDDSIENTDFFYRIDSKKPYSSSYIRSTLESMIRTKLKEFGDNVNKCIALFSEYHEKINNSLDNTKLIYLPTYRTIEKEIPEYNIRKSRIISKGKSFIENNNDYYYFGIKNVEDLINNMLEKIRYTAIEAFSSTSFKTLDTILSDKINIDDENDINKDSLNNILLKLGNISQDKKDKIIEIIYNREPSFRKNYLKFFLNQILDYYQKTINIEKSIENFINIVNSYWIKDESEKHFEYDKKSVTANVINKFTGKIIPLNSLSSGEKQIINVLARLYLYNDKNCIVLIDEPELSLSIDWQRKFLIDIKNSPSCRQLIAVTHSPFVFENELNSFAVPMKVIKRKIGSAV